MAFAATAQNTLDLDALFAEARETSNPLAEPEYCEDGGLLSAPVSASSAELNFEFNAFCQVEGFEGISKGSDRLYLLQGEATNQADYGYAVPLAYKAFELVLGSRSQQGESSAEPILSARFSGALAGRDSVKFGVIYRVSPSVSGTATIRHPSMRGGFDVSLGVPIDDHGQDAGVDTQSGQADTTTEPTNPQPQTDPSENEITTIPFDLNTDTAVKVGHLISDPRMGGAISWPNQGQYSHYDPVVQGDGFENLISDTPRGTGRIPVAGPEVAESLELTFNNDRTAMISAISLGIDVGSRYPPQRVEVFANTTDSENGWTRVGIPVDVTREVRGFKRIDMAFHKPFAAKRLRLAFTADEKSDWHRRAYQYSLSHIRVYEAPEANGYSSVLRSSIVDVLDPARGGHAVAATSQLNDSENSTAGLLGVDPGTYWRPREQRYPQELIFAFAGHDVQDIHGVTASFVSNETLPSDWSPLVRVEVSSDPSPLLGFSAVSNLTPDPLAKSASVVFDAPIRARYLKLVLVDPGVEPFAIDQVNVLGSLYQWLSAEQLFARELKYAGPNAFLSMEDNKNTSRTAAWPLQEGQDIAGLVDDTTPERFYRIDVPGQGPKGLAVEFEGLPRLTASLELMDTNGVVLDRSAATLSGRKSTFNWVVQPGTYFLRLFKEPASIALAIDNSSSMAAENAIDTALEAALSYVASKSADDRITIVGFNGAPFVQQALTSDAMVLSESLHAWKSADWKSTGGTALYDALTLSKDTISEYAGPKAVVLLSDGGDTRSISDHNTFWSQIGAYSIPIFSIGYGADMGWFNPSIGASARDTVRSLSLATEGAFYDAPDGPALKDVFEDIASRLQAAHPYRLKFTLGRGQGQLRIEEVGQELLSASTSGQAIVILDASGSMKAKTDEGRKRIDAARTVLLDLLQQIPEDVPLGLQLYGHSRPSEPKSESCRDSAIVLDPAPANRDDIRALALDISPRGQTPIGYSLAVAGAALKEKAQGLVVLLTDGEETCDADPNSQFNPDRVIAELRAAGIDLRVNIVGFDLEDADIQQGLKTLAEATGGQFFAASGQAALASALQEAFSADVQILDDSNSVVATTRVGGEAISLPEGAYRIQLGTEASATERAQVVAGQLAILTLEREADSILLSSKTDASGQGANTPQPRQFDPASRPPATREEIVYKTQDLLTKLGYDPGPRDGAMGRKTRGAIDEFVADHGMISDAEGSLDANGQPTSTLWLSLYSVYAAQKAD